MKFFVCSDLHLEFLPVEAYQHLFNTFPNMTDSFSKTEGIIIAGDLTTVNYLPTAISMLADRYEHVVFVAGNHEYYGSSILKVNELLSNIQYKNFHFLNNSMITLGGTDILGTTLWFENTPNSFMYRSQLADFSQISDISARIEKENSKALGFLVKNVRQTSIVVTHHMPSHKSVSLPFVGSKLNCFFVCDLENLINSRQPQLWIHGHGHDGCDYMLGDTRILANPYGYVYSDGREKDTFKINCVVDI